MDILDTTFLSPKQWKKKTICVFIVFKEGSGGGG